MSRRFKLFCLLAALLLTLMSVAAAEAGDAAPETAVAETENALPEGVSDEYRLIVTGSEYNLYLREDYMAIVLENRENGALLYSAVRDESQIGANALGQASSGAVTRYLAAGSSSISTETVDLITAGNMQVHTIDYDYSVPNGFRASIRYTNLGIAYDVIVELEGSDLKVTVPHDSIREEMAPTYKLASVTLFPFMGSCYKGSETGYLLMPDGQGALIELKDNQKRYTSLYFDEPVYGKKIRDDKNDAGNSPNAVGTEPVIMPVFGIAYPEKGISFLSVIEEGDVGASICVYPNGAVNLPFDRASAQFEYNYRFTQMMGNTAGAGGMDATLPASRQFDIVQHFLLQSGENANYTGMAMAYRDYLDARGTFDRAEKSEFEIQLDVLCLERENFVLGKQNVVMTTFEQAATMLAELREAGAGALSCVLRGWQEGGLSAALPTDGYKPDGALGGKGGLRTLIDGAASRKIPLMLEADFLSVNTETHPTLTYSAFKKIDSQTWYRSTFGSVYGRRYYLPPQKSLEIAATVVEDMKREGVPGLMLVTMPSFLSDYYENNTIGDSAGMADAYSRLCESAADAIPTTRLAAANAYLWPFAGGLSDLPVTGSDYIFTTCDVPFLAIALSGRIPIYAEYTNFQANTQRFFLRLVEQGTRPSFLVTMEDPILLKNTDSNGIYSSRYALYKDMIVSWSRELGELHATLGDACITGHEMFGNLTHVTWSDGTEVWINFDDEAITREGVTYEPMSYTVKGGE